MMNPSDRRVFVVLLGLALIGAAIADDKSQDAADKDYSAELPRIAPKSPEDSVKAMKLKAGFHAEIVAAEPLIRSPMAMDFDEFGRALGTGRNRHRGISADRRTARPLRRRALVLHGPARHHQG